MPNFNPIKLISSSSSSSSQLLLLICLCSILIKPSSAKCNNDCNLALASYYVPQNTTLDTISTYLNNNTILSNEIVSYNKDKIPNKDVLRSGIRINIPFPCGCVDDSFLGHEFSYSFIKGDTYEKVAQSYYSNLTKWSWIQEVNSYDPNNVPIGGIVSVPVNCSCGDKDVSREFGLFVTYPIRVGDSLSSVSKEFGLNESLLLKYNPGANFSAAGDIVFVPGKDKNGNYPPLVLKNTSGLAGAAIAGICIGAVVVILISVGVYLRCRKTKKMKKASLLSEKSEYQLTGSGSASQGEGGTSIPGIDMGKSVEYSYEELAKATDNFNLSYKIGEGGFGAVYFAELRGEKAAIKKMDMKASREFMAELKVLTHVHHLNLVRLLGYCTEGSLFLVYEHIDNGNLSQHLRGSGRDPLPWSTRVQIALDSARGLEYIHEHTVPVYIHRDIKPANILINKNFQAKVADFGLAKLSEVGNATLPTRLVGTFGYMPPEYAQFGEVSPKVDVFAFGIVLYELISAKEAVVRESKSVVESTGLADLFENVLSKPDANEISKLVDRRLGEDYPLDSVRQMAELAKTCTQDNPHLRPSMRSVVVALTTLSSTTGNWDIDYFHGNNALLNRVSGR